MFHRILCFSISLPFLYPSGKKRLGFSLIFDVASEGVECSFNVRCCSFCVCFPFRYVFAYVLAEVVLNEELSECFDCRVGFNPCFFVGVGFASANGFYEFVKIVAEALGASVSYSLKIVH